MENHSSHCKYGILFGHDKVGYRFVFDSADECTVVHNALYSCLRAIFGISVAGVLVAVFSCKYFNRLYTIFHTHKKSVNFCKHFT